MQRAAAEPPTGGTEGTEVEASGARVMKRQKASGARVMTCQMLCVTFGVLLPVQGGVPPEMIALVQKLASAAGIFDGPRKIVADFIMSEWNTTPRDVTLFELCSGVGELAHQFRLVGYETIEFDKETRHDSEDLTTLPGLLHAARSALRVREGGIAVGGLPCKTFVFMARSSARMRSLSVVSVLFCCSYALLP